jgi:hypothetical protein
MATLDHKDLQVLKEALDRRVNLDREETLVLWEVQDRVGALDLQDHVVMQVHLDHSEPLVLEVM